MGLTLAHIIAAARLALKIDGGLVFSVCSANGFEGLI